LQLLFYTQIYHIVVESKTFASIDSMNTLTFHPKVTPKNLHFGSTKLLSFTPLINPS